MLRGFGFGDAWEKNPRCYSRRIPRHLRDYLHYNLSYGKRNMVIIDRSSWCLYVVNAKLAECDAVTGLKKILGSRPTVNELNHFNSIIVGIAYPRIRRWLREMVPQIAIRCPGQLIDVCVGTDDLDLLDLILSFREEQVQTRQRLLALGSARIIQYVMNVPHSDETHPYDGKYVGAVRDPTLIDLSLCLNYADAVQAACIWGNLETLKAILCIAGCPVGPLLFTCILRMSPDWVPVERHIEMIDLLCNAGCKPSTDNTYWFCAALGSESAELLDCLHRNRFPVCSEWEAQNLVDCGPIARAWLRKHFGVWSNNPEG